MSSSSVSMASAPESSLVLFARGVIARLIVWPALKLAVDQSWGGPESAQKRTWIASVVVDAFDPSETNETPDEDFIEDTLLQILSDEFDTVLEDGSAEVVAKDIVRLWSRVHEAGAEKLVLEIEAKAQKLREQLVVSQEGAGESAEWEGSDSEEDETSGSDEMEIDQVPTLLNAQENTKRNEPEIDEDGFTLVKGKSRSRQ